MFAKQLLTEIVRFIQGIAPNADALSGTKTTTGVNMKHYGVVDFLLEIGTVSTGTATITIEACTDAAGSSPTAITFLKRTKLSADSQLGAPAEVAATGFTTTAASSQLHALTVRARDLPEGKPYVVLKSVEVVDDPIDASVVIALYEPNHAGIELPSVA